MDLHPGSTRPFFSVVLEVDGEQGNIYSLAGSEILKSSGKASAQLGSPKCLVCHLLSLLKPSLKGSLEELRETVKFINTKAAILHLPVNWHRSAAAGRGAAGAGERALLSVQAASRQRPA